MVGSASRWLTRRWARIVMYHRFSPQPASRRLSAAAFEDQVRFLKANFQPCRLSTLVAQIEKHQAFPQKLVALTIDDGYADFMEVAYPILKKHNVPATLFVVTRFVDQAIWLWFDALRYCVTSADPLAGRVETSWCSLRVDLTTSDGREAAWNALADLILPMTAVQREAALAEVEQRLNVRIPPRPPSEFRAMTWDQVRDLDRSIIDIGSHTATHALMVRCSSAELVDEIEGSRARIAEEFGRPPALFCYPNGQPGDYDQSTAVAVARAGYEGAVVAHGTFVNDESDRYLLSRLGAPADCIEFRNEIDGYWHLRRRALVWPSLWQAGEELRGRSAS